MPIGYPGNSITKEARAKAGGGFESAMEIVPAPTGAPAISSVVDNGDGTLTISGSNFGSKTQAAPFKFERFNGTPGQFLSAYDPDWIEYQSGGTKIRSERSHSGSTCVGNTKPGYEDFQTNYLLYPPTDLVRVSYWVYYDLVVTDDYRAPGAPAPTQVKNTRITSTAAAGGGGPYNGAGDMAFGGYTFSGTESSSGPISRDNGPTVLNYQNLPDPSAYVPLKLNAWNRVDMMLLLSDPGVANGKMWVFRTNADGTTLRKWDNLITVGAGESFQQNATILGVMIANYTSEFNNPISVFIDDVYVDTTWAAVEIGDNPDYSICTRRDHLSPSAWSGSSLTVLENNDPIPAGTNYIFVTNSLGEVSSGYEVTI